MRRISSAARRDVSSASRILRQLHAQLPFELFALLLLDDDPLFVLLADRLHLLGVEQLARVAGAAVGPRL